MTATLWSSDDISGGRAKHTFWLRAQLRGALAYIDTTSRLDVIVTDIAMPGIDGVELARKVRGHPSRNALPVIAVTGFYENYMNTQEFDACLKKPINLDALCSAIVLLARGRHS